MKKVTANLHITTLGHGYMSFQHTDHHREFLSLVALLEYTRAAEKEMFTSDEPFTRRARVFIRSLLPRHRPTS